MQATDALSGLRVLDATAGLAGAYATMLLADLGAEVIRLDHDDLVARRALQLFDRRSMDRNKLSVWIEPGRTGKRILPGLLRRSDALLSDATQSEAGLLGLDVATVAEVSPHLVYCQLSDLGLEQEDRLEDVLVQARSGLMQLMGDENTGPLPAGVPFAHASSGAFGALAVLAYLRVPVGTGPVIDVAALDSAVSLLTQSAATSLNTELDMTGFGTRGTIYPYSTFKARDGYIAIAPISNAFWRRFCAAIGCPELATDPRFTKLAGRVANLEDLAAILEPRLGQRTVAEWESLLEDHDIPHGVVNSVQAALGMPQTRHRDMVVPIEEGVESATDTTVVGSPFRFSAPKPTVTELPFRPSPDPGQHTAEVVRRMSGIEPRDFTVDDGPTQAPLADLTVVDFSRMYAGPLCTQLLADLGAEVIKIESPGVGDPTRHNVPRVRDESVYFLSMNRGKSSRCLDLKEAEQLEEVRRLVADADVVVENFRPGVMDRLGLGYKELSAMNPRLVMCSISGFGATGPMRDKTSYDLVNQALAGLIDLSSEGGGKPVAPDLPVSDLAGGMYAALGVLAGLRIRDHAGSGCWIDLSLHDVLISQLAFLGPVEGEGRATEGTLPSPGRGRVLSTRDGYVAVVADGKSEALEELAGQAASIGTVDTVALLESHGWACTPILTIPEVLASDHVHERSLIAELPHPHDGGLVRLVSSPFMVDGQRVVTTKGPPPLCGSSMA